MGVPENIDALLVKYDIKPSTLARIADVTPAAVSGWRSGAKPRNDAVERICNYFNLTEDDILSEHYGLAAKEHGMFPTSIPPSKILAGAIRPKKSERATAPLLGRVHAGDPQDPDVFDGPMIELPKCISDAHPDAYFLELEGDCMNKVYSTEASLVLIDPTMEPKNGDIGVVSINGEDYVIRRIIKTADTLILHPESFNPVHKDIVIDLNSEAIVESAGVAVFFQAKRDLSQQ